MNHLANPIFTNETKAREWLESQIWPDGPHCPHCGSYSATSLKGEAHRPGLYQCNDCRQQFTVTVGTVFEKSKIPLTKWLMAVFLLSASKKGISTAQLSRMFALPYKTAWFMTHRICEAMRDDSSSPLGGAGKVVEADETYIGNKKRSRWRHTLKPGKGWVQHSGGNAYQYKVISLVERGGKARSVHVAFLTANTARDVLVRNVIRKSDLMTDESNIYKEVDREFSSHGTVNHSVKEYARDLVHTNTIECFFSIFKRGMRCVYQHCSEQHLHRYLAEFDFRYSNRAALGVDDLQRAAIAAKGIVGKRLTYRRTNEARYA